MRHRLTLLALLITGCAGSPFAKTPSKPPAYPAEPAAVATPGLASDPGKTAEDCKACEEQAKLAAKGKDAGGIAVR